MPLLPFLVYESLQQLFEIMEKQFSPLFTSVVHRYLILTGLLLAILHPSVPVRRFFLKVGQTDVPWPLVF